MNDDDFHQHHQHPTPTPPARRIGSAVLWLAEKGLILYYAGTDPATPRWAKAVLVAGIASFFSVDVLLDVFALPIGIEVSFASVFVAACAFLFSIKRRHIGRAREKIDRFLNRRGPPAPPLSSPPLLKL